MQQLNLTNEYTKCMNEMYVPLNNKNHYYIYVKGLESIYNIFDYLLYNTRNINLVKEHCQKVIYFYIEFINQIMDDSNVFLNLTIMDAVLFIYKKTIFNINKSFCKNMEQPLTIKEKRVYDTLIIHGKIMKVILNYVYFNDSQSDSVSNKSMSISISNSSMPFNDLYTNFHYIFTTMKQINSYDLSYKNYSNLYYFAELLEEYFNNIYTIEQFIECISKISKNLRTLDISPNKMRDKVYITHQITSLKPSQLIKLFE
jgi:hypothetical protein